MRRSHGLKFRSQTPSSGKRSSSSLARNTAIQCACCRSAEHRARSTVTRWNSAAARTLDPQAKSDHSVSRKKKRSQRAFGALKRFRAPQPATGQRRKRRDSRRNSKSLRTRRRILRLRLCLKATRVPQKCCNKLTRAQRNLKRSTPKFANGRRKRRRRQKQN